MATNPFKGLLCLMRHMRFLKTSATHFRSSPPLPSSLAVRYLTNSLGLSLEKALAFSQKLGLDDNKWPKFQSVFEFLKSYEFTDTDLGKLVTVSYPSSIFSNQVKTLKLKFEYLVDRGFVGLLLPTLVLSNPHIMNRGLRGYIIPLFDFLKKYLLTNENIIVALKRSGLLMSVPKMQQNVEFLLSENLPLESIRKLLLRKPMNLNINSDRVVSTLNTLKKMGILPDSKMLPNTLEVILSFSESGLKKKFEFLKSLGWEEDDILSGIMRYPNFLSCSEENIKRSMYFYVDTMKMEPGIIKRRPVFLCFSIDKRVIPRYNLVKFLETKCLIKPIKSFFCLILMSEKDFVKKYVSMYETEVPDLMEFYKANK